PLPGRVVSKAHVASPPRSARPSFAGSYSRLHTGNIAGRSAAGRRRSAIVGTDPLCRYGGVAHTATRGRPAYFFVMRQTSWARGVPPAARMIFLSVGAI